MKKLLLFITILTFGVSSVNAQDSNFYLGVGAGYATAGGELEEDYKGGIHINFLNMGYRFNETWGITANLGSAGHSIDDSDTAIGIGAFSVGPMMSFPVGNMTWDLKPQYAFNMKGVFRGDEAAALGLEDVEMSGTAFIIGNSLVMGGGQGFTWSIDIDYLMGKFDEVEGPGGTAELDDEEYNSLRIGVGVRYNF